MPSLFPDIPSGATISEISPLPSDPNVRRVRIGRRVVARLRVADIERLELAPGMEWTDELAARVWEAIELDKARKDAFTMLGRKALSRAELTERLMKKSHASSVAERIADEFTEDGWIDDAALARAIIDHQRARTPAGEHLLRDKMQQRGIPDAVAEQTLSDQQADGNPIDEAHTLAEQRYRSMRSLPAPTAARRLAGALHRRGFDEETIETVLHQMGFDETE